MVFRGITFMKRFCECTHGGKRKVYDMIQYRNLCENEMNRELFREFVRRQVVTKCWRKIDGEWVVKDVPFIDDWTEEEYEELIDCLKHTITS